MAVSPFNFQDVTRMREAGYAVNDRVDSNGVRRWHLFHDDTGENVSLDEGHPDAATAMRAVLELLDRAAAPGSKGPGS